MGDILESTSQYGLRSTKTFEILICGTLGHAKRQREQQLAGGLSTASDYEIVVRPILAGAWSVWDAPENEGPKPAAPRTRQFVKETAARKQPAAKTVVKKVVTRQVEDDPVIYRQLFEDSLEQLLYEIRHFYLMTVPLSQREQWPYTPFKVSTTFLNDVESQASVLSRQQIIAACVDVITGRVADVPSRQARRKREGGGDSSRPVTTRTDGAIAWRANINEGTPGARRIMWWRLPSGSIELARLAHHDDTDM